MHQLVQAAIAAAKQGNKPKAVELLKEALSTNPNDIEAWLVLSRVVDQSDCKRQCLNRVLALDPTNKLAREALLKLDRTAMSTALAQPVIAPVLPETPQPSSSHSLSRAAHYYLDASRTAFEVDQLESERVLNELKENPLIFTDPSIPTRKRAFAYYATALGICAFLLVRKSDIDIIYNFILILFVIGAACLTALRMLLSLRKIELRDSGIHASTLFTHCYTSWNEIVSLKSVWVLGKLKLISNRGKSITISIQIEGYPVIVEIIRLKRPDLFGGGPAPTQAKPSAPAFEQSQSTSTPAFTEAKTFKRDLLELYGLTVGGILFCLVLVLLAAEATNYGRVKLDVTSIFAFLLVASIGALLIIGPFFSISAVTLKPNKLIIKNFFRETEISADEIKEIKMGTVQEYRRFRDFSGFVRNFVGIRLFDGRYYGITGFTTGEEIIYGFLMNWWENQRSR